MVVDIAVWVIILLCILLGGCLWGEYYLVPMDVVTGKLYHYTTEKGIDGILKNDSKVYLKESNKLYSPKGLYFFQKKPGLIDRVLLKLQQCKFVVIININDIEDKSKLYLRPLDKTIVYKSEYRGLGYIKKFDDNVYTNEMK